MAQRATARQATVSQPARAGRPGQPRQASRAASATSSRQPSQPAKPAAANRAQAGPAAVGKSRSRSLQAPPDPPDKTHRVNVAGRAVATGQAATRGGMHALAAELLLFAGIVALRAVAQYGPADKSDLPADQFGPLFILGNGLALFFVLSFLAARGGNAAKVAVGFGAVVDVALLLKSLPHLEAVAAELSKPRRYKPASLQASAQPEAAAPALQYELTNRQLPPAPTGQSAQAAMRYARKALPSYGLRRSQFNDLVKLWSQESGWDTRAVNPNSGATGIPQLNPNDSKVPAGWLGKQAVKIQVDWGLAYIRHRYGSIASAWAHEQHLGWY